MIKIIHTSDWHLGRQLYSRKRDEEFEQFLTWILDQVTSLEIDVFLIAGDIFDTPTPPVKAQSQYYSFLAKLAKSCCRHIVIIGGNHDSPSFLEAPKYILKDFNIHIVGATNGDYSQEVIPLYNLKGELELIVCAVAYLREKDIRKSEPFESYEEKNKNLLDAIHTHYKKVAELANELRGSKDIPVIAMGHLFAAKSKTIEDDGVRELYVGGLAKVNSSIFEGYFDYVALGHLHLSQTLGGHEWIRYSGTPLPMGFSEAGHKKSFCLVRLDKSKCEVDLIEIPCFQKLVQIEGDQSKIEASLLEWMEKKESIWVEVKYTGDQLLEGFFDRINDMVDKSEIEILRFRNENTRQHYLSAQNNEVLTELSIDEVFQFCLDFHKIEAKDQREILTDAHNELIFLLNSEDES